MGIRDGGKFALGLVSGICATLVILVYSPGCGKESSSLWFCGESPEVVVATLSFISELIASLAWPLAVLLLGLLFQRKINTLLGSMKRLKAPGIEAEFNELVEDAESNLADEKQAVVSEPSEVSPRILKYLQVDKKYAVIAAWLEIEGKLLKLAEQMNVLDYTARKPNAFRDVILRRLEFPEGIVEAIRDLRSARNAVAHANANDMTESSVIKYLQIATEINGFLDSRIQS